MKASVIKEMTTQEVVDQIGEEQINYDKLKMAHTISPLENPGELTAKRKDIARLKTDLRQRELNVSEA
jgi:large subunit ribosomal protein L29